MLGKKTSSGIEAISTIGKIDVGTTSVIVKVEDGIVDNRQYVSIFCKRRKFRKLGEGLNEWFYS